MAKKAKKTTKKAAAKNVVKAKTSVKKAVKKTAGKTASSKKKAVAKKTVNKKTTTPKATSKKTSIKKTTAERPAGVKKRKRPQTHLTKAELLHFRELLIEKLKELMGNVSHFELESLKKSRMDASGDLSSMPIHMADVGSDNYEQEFTLGLMDSERKIVMEIQDALKRIENNSYGICEGTQEPIPKPRLEGIPWTRYCVQYAEMLEKGLVVAEQQWYDDDEEEEPDEDASEIDEDDVEDDTEEEDGEDEYDQDEYDDGDIEEMYYGFDDDDE